jgi:hypothetical protein
MTEKQWMGGEALGFPMEVLGIFIELGEGK